MGHYDLRRKAGKRGGFSGNPLEVFGPDGFDSSRFSGCTAVDVADATRARPT